MYIQEKKIVFQNFPLDKSYGDNEDFFRVLTPQGEVRLDKLPFQLNQPLPDTLSCRVRGFNGTLPVLGHNMPYYVNEFYADGVSKGQTFDFRVIGKSGGNGGYYKLEDENGLQFKLHDEKAALTYGQTVKCRFEVLDQKMYILRRSDSDSQLKMVGLRRLPKIVQARPGALEKIEAKLRELPEFAKAIDELDNGHSSWIYTALRVVRTNMPRLFKWVVDNYSIETVRALLSGCRTLSLYLLEGSDFLRNVPQPDRRQMQNELTSQIELIDTYSQALEIISRKGQRDFISTLLQHLKASGYIYHPNLQFSVMMILFRMMPELVNTSLGNIFDTLMEWSPDTWKAEPFRQAFVEQLEIYISDTRESIDNFLVPETPSDNEKIVKVLTAIAIQQSLAIDSDHIDKRLNMSLFYRYLSMLRQVKADTLLNKSYLELMNVKLPIDFTWSDIKEPIMMMTRAAVDPPVTAKVPDTPRYYVNDKIEVEVGAEGISIARTDENADNQVRNGMLPWPGETGLKAFANIDHEFTRAKSKTIEGHAEFWKDVETALFNPVIVTETYSSVRMAADIDDVVRIEVDRVIPSANDPNRIEAFHCKIVDDHYLEGEGYLRAEDLVTYNLHGVTAGTFRCDDGSPMQFDATVIAINEYDGTINFSLYEAAQEAIRDITWSGARCNAVVTKDNGRSYSAISDKGYGLYIKKDPDDIPYHTGNVLAVTITNVDNNIVQGVAEDGPLDGVLLNNARSLHNLLKEIAVNIADEEPEMDLDEEETISAEDLSEIAEILRYKAVTRTDNIIEAYDYLSYAHLLARAINNQQQAAAIKAQREILLQHKQYARNKALYRDDIERIKAIAPDNKLIQRMASKLDIVTSLGNPQDNPSLWNIVNSSDNEDVKNLAQMVLSYNLLTAMGGDDNTGSAIKEKIANALNVSSEQHVLKYYGSESQYVEFKSSLVFPARKNNADVGMPDPDKQEFEILHIIAGFMNTTGGKLYIGVSDEHYERGLDGDFNFYKTDNSERNNSRRRSIKSLDNMANYLQNLIDKAYNLGTNAGDYAKTYIDDESKKGVIIVKIDPCPHIVFLDNTIYVRHSAKTTPLLKKEEIDQFIADRKHLYEQQVQASAPSAPDAPSPTILNKSIMAQPAEAPTEAPEAPIADEGVLSTSRIRHNVLHEYLDPEHFVSPRFYLRFVNDHEYIVTTSEWSFDEQGDRLVLAITDDEAEKNLLLVYEDESVVKVPMRELLQKKTDTPYSHFADKRLVFACPVGPDDGIYSIHTNSKGSVFERLTPVEEITSGSMTSTPIRIMEAESASSDLWEVVPENRVRLFDNIKSTGLKRSQIGALAKGGINARVTVKDAIGNFYRKV